jgi:outer membrane protein assembly factor BamB
MRRRASFGSTRIKVQPGLNVYVTQSGQEARLIEMKGKFFHVWHAGRKPTSASDPSPNQRRKAWFRTVQTLPNGDLLPQTDYGPLRRIDWESNVVWQYRGRTHHDFDVREDGVIYVLTNSASDVEGLSGKVLEGFIVELDQNGRTLRRLSIMSALRLGGQQHIIEKLQAYQSRVTPMLAFDPMHTNTIEWLDGRHSEKLAALARGNLLISLPMIDRLAIVNFGRGEVAWSMKGRFRLQHDPTLLGNGNILLFDNKGLEGNRCRIPEIDPTNGDEVWSYSGADDEVFRSECCRRVERLPNGNTLVVDSKRGRAFEFDSKREFVWEFKSPDPLGERVANLNDLIRVPLSVSQ